MEVGGKGGAQGGCWAGELDQGAAGVEVDSGEALGGEPGGEAGGLLGGGAEGGTEFGGGKPAVVLGGAGLLLGGEEGFELLLLCGRAGKDELQAADGGGVRERAEIGRGLCARRTAGDESGRGEQESDEQFRGVTQNEPIRARVW